MTANSTELLQYLIRKPLDRSKPRESFVAMIRRLEGIDEAHGWYDELVKFIPEETENPLREYFRLALLGVCYGFIENGLSPYINDHTAIVPPLLEEIQAVYDEVAEEKAEYDPDEFRYRSYDYGLHKATYLDWTLYQSRELY